MARILIADNDPDALALALLDLGLEGHTVLGAVGGDEAVALIDEFRPDVVVLDYRMPPGPTGLQVAARLRVDRPGLRLVIYSNYQDVDIVRQVHELGIPFLPKGNLATLRNAVA